MSGQKKKKIYNRSLERALNILCAFSLEKRELSLTELSKALNLPKATVYRLCSTLVEYDFLRFDQNLRNYFLGLKLFTLGAIVFSSFSIRRAASAHLTQLQSKLGETVFLGVLEEDDLIYIDKREDVRKPIRFASDIGTRRPPYFGMLGQVLMAFLEDKEVVRILKRNPLVAFTKKSIIDRDVFKERLQKIRKQGFHVDEGEALEGITGISAPIRDYEGKVIAAVGVGLILTSKEDGSIEMLTKHVVETANKISENLGSKGIIATSRQKVSQGN